jgi:HEAT repeat protein
MSALARALLYIISLAVAGYTLYKRRQRSTIQPVEPVSPSLANADPDTLQRALHDPQWHIRREAVRVLGLRPIEGAAEWLAPLLGDADNDVREATATSMAALGSRATALLTHALQNGTLDARISAANALKLSADATALPALLEALKHDESAWVRIPAAQALGKIGGDAALEALGATLEDEHSDVARAVREILATSTNPAAEHILRAHPVRNGNQNSRGDTLIELS